jgi:uncharacterized membrane protein required for colicin V production
MNARLSVFDGFVAIVLAIGLLRGRKRGISEEFLDVLQWICIVLGAGFGYRFVGDLLISQAKFPVLLGNVVAYLVCAAIVLFLFRMVKRAVGEKLVQGDVFGRFEFYLGMIAGVVRFFCILMFVLAIVHAKYSTPQDRERFAKLQRDNFGSISFPTFDELQYAIFFKSLSGNEIEKHLSMVLIQPKPPGPDRPANTIGRRRENAVNEVFK